MRWITKSSIILASLAALLFCGNFESIEHNFGTHGTITETDDSGQNGNSTKENDDGSENGGEGENGSDGGNNSGSGNDDNEKMDVGEDDPFPSSDVSGEVTEEQCKAIDFLFIIDNSGSMADQQASLIASFPGFVNGILNTIPTLIDYQVGVVTTDAYLYNTPYCQSLGGLVVETGGSDSSNAVCGPYADGKNFMTQNDDLMSTFACAAQVGTSGNSNEQPLGALINSLEGWLNSPGKCNEGFLRDEPLLVVIIITDEEDHSGGVTEDWYEHLVWLKYGGEESVVILTLTMIQNGLCLGGVSWDLIEFTQRFPYGFVGDVCAGSYDQFFHDAIWWIAEACGVQPQ